MTDLGLVQIDPALNPMQEVLSCPRWALGRYPVGVRLVCELGVLRRLTCRFVGGCREGIMPLVCKLAEVHLTYGT